MIKTIAAATWLGIMTLLTGCASLTPPSRPAYTGPDNVENAQASQLVGTWSVRDLNPYPDMEPQSTTIQYLADGRVTGLIVPQGKSADALGNMQFQMTAQWSLDGDTVTHENVEVNSIGDNGVGSMIASMMNNSTRNSLAGRANIYELSGDRIVMVGSDGAAMEYTRQ